MFTTRSLWFLSSPCAVMVAGLAGCLPQGPELKATYPMTGQVFVDGKPAENLAVTAHQIGEVDKRNLTQSAAFTDAEGRFTLSTYKQGDGIPEGDYVLTFVWGEINVFQGGYGGPDKLNDRYAIPEESRTRAHVEKGKPTDLGKIELTTK